MTATRGIPNALGLESGTGDGKSSRRLIGASHAAPARRRDCCFLSSLARSSFCFCGVNRGDLRSVNDCASRVSGSSKVGRPNGGGLFTGLLPLPLLPLEEDMTAGDLGTLNPSLKIDRDVSAAEGGSSPSLALARSPNCRSISADASTGVRGESLGERRGAEPPEPHPMSNGVGFFCSLDFEFLDFLVLLPCGSSMPLARKARSILLVSAGDNRSFKVCTKMSLKCLASTFFRRLVTRDTKSTIARA
mmetsp:Transcript_24281/g.43041  ORF Transcript_24281/g.43041 Transcript_24281/m.43041 type:complete len:247 (-) Transcript_24281:260-1000(-)|eukprot:CAMPEP_0197517586 /NCGR_PEP_ID=MMETSP1318-20131121/2626_1 /TAXON_ID=552666 /ORGANISM="Partenskyella glossopodia, Strain RCC365" /LENGTH=246 /DNA_ID=CAMNT_0043067271 /DNA_START=1103 /DNA_END=1843 /DNA_ORIENTATION=+